MKNFLAVIIVLIFLLNPYAKSADAEPVKVARTINSANPEPQMRDWHPHNQLGLERGAFAGVKAFNRVLIREESGELAEVPFFFFTMRDLGELMFSMAKFPAETKVIGYKSPSTEPIVHVNASDLKLGPLAKWPNKGLIGGSFCSMNVPPVVEDIQGRRAVHFDCNQWYFDTQYNAMVLDAIPAEALKDGKPFTMSAWVLHPKDPDVDDPEMIMSWHKRGGNDGTGLDWKRIGGWGDFYVAGLGGDLQCEPKPKPVPIKEWTNVTYVYTGGFKGELRIYENGKLANVARSKYLPVLREPVEIKSDSVVLKGYLQTAVKGEAPVIRGYIGEYDAHHFPQLRHVGRWDQMIDIGPTTEGDFSIPFKGLKPGTRYYYRIYAGYNTDTWIPNQDPTRCWAIGVGSFVTATADGQPGKIIPPEEDRYIFLGVQWGSRWYGSYPGPAGWFRGYMSDVKLYDRALTDDEIRVDSNATVVYDGYPADKSNVDLDKIDFTWKRAISSAKGFRFYMHADRAKVADGTAESKELKDEKLEGVKLKPGSDVYWRVDTLGDDGKVLAQGPVWQFHVTCGEVSKPQPEQDSTTSATGYFKWAQSISSIKSQRLFYGTDSDAVLKGTAKVMKLDGGNRDCVVPPGTVYPGARWYWRVETEFKDGSVLPGPVWSFKTYDYFVPEFDGPASEPFPAAINPARASKLMEGLGHPTISTPRADEATMRDIAHATKRYLWKSLQLRNQMASHLCGTIMGSPEGPPCVDGFQCDSYGGMPGWNITMHEMGHQTQGSGFEPMDPYFHDRLMSAFNSHADNNAWLGDYASVNIYENMAVNGHNFLSGKARENLLREDAPTYYLLAKYLPGDMAVELHPANGLITDPGSIVLKWENRAGIEDVVPGHQHYAPMPETVGTFNAIGSPTLKTVKGASAVVFNGSDALAWDRNLTYGFVKNRAWSVEVWALAYENENGILAAWGPDGKGVRIAMSKSGLSLDIGGNKSDVKFKSDEARWHHVAVVFEGGGLADTAGALKIFVDGTEMFSKHYKLDLETGALMVGGLANTGKVEQGFKGALAHLRVYNYDISVDQVSGHYSVEHSGYEHSSSLAATSNLYIDLDASQLAETGNEDHRPLYPESLCKPWVRSWANRGLLAGRVHNDISSQWHYSGSTPIYGEVDGIQAVQFNGKDRMVGVFNPNEAMLKNGAGTIEMVVFNGKNASGNAIFQWGGFTLDSSMLKPGWQHVAVSPEGAKSIVYIDGVKAGDLPYILKPEAIDHPHFGAYFDKKRESWYRFFNGAIAQVRLYDKALTAEQVLADAKLSPVFVAHSPEPSDDSKIVAERKPALKWISGKGAPDKESVMFGEDPAKLAVAGSFKSGEFSPSLAGGKRYFWKVGESPVWSFETRLGELVSLNAADLKDGKLEVWQNKGQSSGKFIPSDRKDILGIPIELFRNSKAFRIDKGKLLTLRPEGSNSDILAKGPFTISFRVASENRTDSAPLFSWGEPDSACRLWFGTWTEDRRLLTTGKFLPPNAKYPAEDLKLIYPEGCNARMCFVWKTITVTYADGLADMWYNKRRYDSRKVDFKVEKTGEIRLGWKNEVNASVLLSDLSVYGCVLGEAEIAKLADGQEPGGQKALIRITAKDLEPGTRAANIRNTGSLGGIFQSEPETDRRPEVMDVAGRKAVAFNGTAMLSSDFNLPEAVADARPFTVEIWALQDEPSKDSCVLALSQQVSQRYTALMMGSQADKRAIRRPFSGADWKISGDEKTGRWVHLAYVFDGGMQSKIRLYRDGKLNAEYDYKTVDTIAGYPLSIGGIMSAATAEKDLFKGAVSSVRIFDYPRTAEEIAKSAADK